MRMKKVVFLVTCVMMFAMNVCFATPMAVQLNDYNGAGYFLESYNIFASKLDSSLGPYGMGELVTVNKGKDIDIYGAFNKNDSENLIEFFCNKPGYVSVLAIVATRPEQIEIEGSFFMELLTRDFQSEDYEVLVKTMKTSVENTGHEVFYRCYKNNRIYVIQTAYQSGHYVTRINAFIQ